MLASYKQTCMRCRWDLWKFSS